MTGKEIYARRKRLRAERLLAQEERAQPHHQQHDEDGEFLFACLAASLERIADALEKILPKKESK